MKRIEIVVNGVKYELYVKPSELLINTLRDRLGFKSVKYGCGIGECGNCTVLVNGEPVLSCLVLTIDMDGKEILTVEGLSEKGLTDIQRAFIEEGAVQCGYCTPAFILMTEYLLRENTQLDVDIVKEYLKGILCRCTGYVNIVKAAIRASRERIERLKKP